MGKETNITCDCCGEKLSIETTYPHNYGLVLRAEDFKKNVGGVQYAVHITPPIDSEKVFCNVKCLNEWLTENFTI